MPLPSRPSRTAGAPAPAPGPTLLPLRVYRWSRATAHVLEGLAMTAILFPLVGRNRRRTLSAIWSRRLLRILRIEARVHGQPTAGLAGNMLIVANHVSWLDIFVLNTLQPARFIAKSELKRWPLVGRFATNAGTLFIDRARRHDTHKVNRHAAEVLAHGDVIAIFPEGTTTDGRDVLPFHGSLLQPIVDAEGHVQPVAIRYLHHDGGVNDAVAYVGDTSFAQSFWRVTGERRVVVELHVAPLLPARARHRRELSRAAEAAIRRALALPVPDSEPETPGDRPA
ncbi:MAG: 1-acyl-sn-glycerol-3-phosphate acyltransferase [Betaproteobacteria bacterium]|nr:1-acyl-sn-glycerol-3-phosphate acyltransferase [Betaproteobacteria bacterium]